MNAFHRFAVGVMLLFGAAHAVFAQNATAVTGLQVAVPFGDHMVLQRDLPVNIWGTAAAGTPVSVAVAETTATAIADVDGHWKAVLPPLHAGGPYQLTVKGGGAMVRFSDVLVGEVWLCSGQSNMSFTLNYFKAHGDPTLADDIAAAGPPLVRLGSIAHRVAFTPVTDTPVRWTACTPETVAKYSATAYFFACALQKKLGVPVGVMNASWGGTPAEAWTDRATLDSSPTFQPAIRRLEMYKDQYPKLLAAWEQRVAAAKQDSAHPPLPIQPQPQDKNPHLPTALWNALIHPLVPMTCRGVVWYQGEADAARQQPNLYAELLPAMFAKWRSAFGRGDALKILIVQLPAFGVDRTGLAGSFWAQIRDAQARTAAALPDAALCVTLDLGDPDLLHPPTKRQLGSRLAAIAARWPADASSPPATAHFERADFTDDRAVLHLANVTGPLVISAASPPGDFQLAGDDKVWHVASATLDGTTVILRADRVPHPIAARYAWSDSPRATLTDAGLPLPPFRTDIWPLLADHRPTTRPTPEPADDTP